MAYESVVAGHFEIRQTFLRIADDLFWPGICGDVTSFCKSCRTCQRVLHKRSEICGVINTPSKRVACGVPAIRELPLRMYI